jgi:hypothetical protein
VRLPDTLIDTCCLLNLCAVDDPKTVLPHIPVKWQIARAAATEELSIRPTPDGKRADRRRIDLQPCFDAGVLTLCDPRDEAEQLLYVQLAQEVDDGEAMSLAIAAVRAWAVSTDDLAARRVAQRLGILTVATPELLRLWAKNSRADAMSIAQAIRNIETLARYSPTPATPDYQWWLDHRNS